MVGPIPQTICLCSNLSSPQRDVLRAQSDIEVNGPHLLLPPSQRVFYRPQKDKCLPDLGSSPPRGMDVVMVPWGTRLGTGRPLSSCGV